MARGGLVALLIWAGKSHGGGEMVERFIHDGDPVSSSWLPSTIVETSVTPLWLQLNIPEAAEGALLVGGGAKGTIWLLWSTEICFADAIGYGGDVDLGPETNAKDGGASLQAGDGDVMVRMLMPAKLDAGGGISWARALVHNWIWVSKSIWQPVCRFWAPICAQLLMVLTAKTEELPSTMSVFKSWLVEWPSATLMAGKACWWVLRLLGPLVATAALQSSFGTGSLGSRMSIGSLYPFLN